MRVILAGLIRGYQLLLSPLLPPACRFYPSCSAYARNAILEHGALSGTWLALRRFARCNPWHRGGVEFVPAATRSLHHRER